MRKKRKHSFLITIVILIAVGIGGWLIYQNGRTQEFVVAELAEPTLPTISFVIHDYKVNELLAYTREMDISAAREWLTPVDAQGKVHIQINDYGNDIQGASYQVNTLDGKDVLLEGELESELGELQDINLNVSTTDILESVLNIKLTIDGEDVHYYTRIVGYDQLMLEENLNFVDSVHNATLDKKEVDYLSSVLDNIVESNVNDLQNVSLNSSIKEIQWCDLNPTTVGEVKWRITESSSVYTGIELNYIVNVNIGNGPQYYMVQEYYRTGYNKASEMIQLDGYMRNTTEIYQSQESDIDQKKIKIGLNGQALGVTESPDQNIVTFTQAKELFSYNSNENKMRKIFGNHTWSNDHSDSRLFINQYDVCVIDVDNSGNISFIVYGYVNRGENEGLVGTSIYYYDALLNTTVERAFICTDKSYSVYRDEFIDSTYYRTSNQEIYIIVNQIIYAINLETMKQRQISQELESEGYTFSNDKGYLAFNSGEEDILSKITVLSVDTGEEYTVQARDDEFIYPLGFVGADLVVGYAREKDTLDNYRGEPITPAYEVEVRSIEGDVIKTYKQDKCFVESASIEEQVVYLNQVTELNGEYVNVGVEYIANNEAQKESSVGVVKSSDNLFGTVKSIMLNSEPEGEWTYEEAIHTANKYKIIIAYETSGKKREYQVYAYGKMYKKCDSIEEAIALADTHYGYVLNANQGYIWRRGARALNYSNFVLEDEIKAKLASGLGVMEVVQHYGANSIENYTGLTLENLCYLIYQDQVIGVEFTDGNKGILTGYTVDTIYYLDESGTKRSGDIARLSSQVDTIMGNSNLY